MPVVKGVKSPSERFAGAEETYTIEALMQDGWALQSGTSHFLGQTFAKAFDCSYTTDKGAKEYVWATSWGTTTRLIGAMVMTHSDDTGLVLPPRVAPVQLVVVPIVKSQSQRDNVDEMVTNFAEEIACRCRAAGVRVEVDARVDKRPGAKYFEWERQGVPLRLSIGARDLKSQQVEVVERHSGHKSMMPIEDMALFVMRIKQALEHVHADMYARAVERMKAKTFVVHQYDEMKQRLLQARRGDDVTDDECGTMTSSSSSSSSSHDGIGFFLAPWRCNAEAEEQIKKECKATIRCYPFAENALPLAEDVRCFYSGEKATHMALFARSY